MSKNLFWILIGAAVLYALQQKKALGVPLFPDAQPAGCLPGDPSVSFGGKTYCLPQGIFTY